MRRRLRPHHEDVGDRRIRDPHLGPGEPVAVGDLLGAGSHGAGIGAGVGLGQAEAADPLARGEPRQILLALLLRSVGVDRIHDERGLHAIHGAVAAVDALDLAGDEAIGDVVGAGAAVLLGQRGAEQTERPHLVENGAVGLLLQVGLDHAGGELLLRVGAGGVADGALVLGELVLEEERILPVEGARPWRAAGVLSCMPANSLKLRCCGAAQLTSHCRRKDLIAFELGTRPAIGLAECGDRAKTCGANEMTKNMGSAGCERACVGAGCEHVRRGRGAARRRGGFRAGGGGHLRGPLVLRPFVLWALVRGRLRGPAEFCLRRATAGIATGTSAALCRRRAAGLWRLRLWRRRLRWLRYRALDTGSRYWWSRYYDCVNGYY